MIHDGSYVLVYTKDLSSTNSNHSTIFRPCILDTKFRGPSPYSIQSSRDSKSTHFLVKTKKRHGLHKDKVKTRTGLSG